MGKKRQRKIVSLIMTIAMVLSLIMVPSGQVQAATKLKATVSNKTIAVKQTVTIKTNVKATFKSSNKKIATVSSKGVVKGKKAGKAKITVTSKSNKKQKKIITITVKDLVVKAPDGSKATLNVGEQTKIKTNLSSTYKSSNKSVATVSSNGTVTAKKTGTAKITVTSKKYKKLQKKVTITVKNAKQPTSEDEDKTTEKPTTEKPTTEKPTTEKPTTEKPTTEKPTTETPTTETPSTETPTTETPSTENPTQKNEYLEVQAKGIVPNDWHYDVYSFIVYLKSDNDTPKLLGYDEYSVEYINTIEENGKMYQMYQIVYQQIEQTVKVETIILPDNVLYVDSLDVFNEEFIERGIKPEFENLIDIELCFGNGTYSDIRIKDIEDYERMINQDFSFGSNEYNDLELNIDNLYWGRSYEYTNSVRYDLVYDYYFGYEENLFFYAASSRLRFDYPD